jgi:hypothetical protein
MQQGSQEDLYSFSICQICDIFCRTYKENIYTRYKKEKENYKSHQYFKKSTKTKGGLKDSKKETTELSNTKQFFFSFFFYDSYVHTRLGSFLPPAPTPST